MSTLVIAEFSAAGVSRATRQVVTAAQHWGAPVDLLLVGPADTAAHTRITGVRSVLHADAPHLAQPVAEDLARLLETLAGEYEVILAPHNSLARNALPRLAARRGVGMISDAVALLGPRTYQRPLYAGNLLATVENQPGLQLLTVRASRFAIAGDEGQAQIRTLETTPADGRSRVTGRHSASSGRPELGSARVVVSGGRSLGSEAQFNTVLAPLADRLGAALGATRAAVDAGYAPNEWQVGQTGTIVAPDLYIAIGISGAVQHTAGIKDSKVIVAINQDPDAPIMQIADYTLTADLFEAVPELVRQLAPKD
ncbi:MAG: electron transfer flavoprotein subunit alpha [Candidatus Dactylopiibacterium carminicum]|uniref:Electron transfer flavoprotein subunit alpha n=1 Tax=Candidatus Dactylopiibacterium carminicum TaxID=857335 RepID=A0A272ES68_9RHOO|nr:FAD-binding protein [Candidatus Dactylopiibacterium carminicum]KAF7599002.1 electron transfer flavoprotein subunit alpha [Candidatus Dactylopiibacterium carminicum]PAS92932.1 MAG: electron transfer flavoprotein subunit alpha [Candidatus Dactylopiibacterium carminicum]PAS96583.1 MAG: electron transfer flavoprotein subunit alpha [Candidatus Dactylopiibacterium carminicum]PAS99013.1 MAG: electron transfer flavoprotein subunit alpha [Candidatus Dactylopiibacterium carminicum]